MNTITSSRRPGRRHVGLALTVAAAAAAWSAGCAGRPGDAASRALRTLTHAHTRVVWVQQVQTNGADVDAFSDQLWLMGLDTDDGRGARKILRALGNYHRPLLTPDGQRIVYTDIPQGQVQVINWDGHGRRTLGPGVASAVWRDPATRHDWVYVVRGVTTNSDGVGTTVERVRLDAPKVRERVWDQTPVQALSFQPSPDGAYAIGLFPWPKAALVHLTDGAMQSLGKGCWPGLAPNNDRLGWVFDGPHRNLRMFCIQAGTYWTTAVNTAPSMRGFEVYHPRWSNHERFLTLTGPYVVGDSDNRIGGGGGAVEVYVGRFSPDWRRVEDWVQVTQNSHPDYFPDVWIAPGAGDPGARPLPPQPAPPAPVVTARPNPAPAPAPRSFHVWGTLQVVTPTPTLQAIAPYKQALAAYVYRAQGTGGPLTNGQSFAVAHWVLRAGQPAAHPPALGTRVALTLERYEQHPELEGERLVLDPGVDPELPLFYDVGAR